MSGTEGANRVAEAVCAKVDKALGAIEGSLTATECTLTVAGGNVRKCVGAVAGSDVVGLSAGAKADGAVWVVGWTLTAMGANGGGGLGAVPDRVVGGGAAGATGAIAGMVIATGLLGSVTDGGVCGLGV